MRQLVERNRVEKLLAAPRHLRPALCLPCALLIATALTPAMAQKFVAIFKPLGFHYVTIDLEGYRQGSLNSVLKQNTP